MKDVALCVVFLLCGAVVVLMAAELKAEGFAARCACDEDGYADGVATTSTAVAASPVMLGKGKLAAVAASAIAAPSKMVTLPVAASV